MNEFSKIHDGPATEGGLASRRQAVLSPARLAVVLGFLASLAAAFLGSYVYTSAREDARLEGFDRLGLYAASIRAAFGRYDYLPDVFSRLKPVQDLVSGGGDAGAVNALLLELAVRSNADVLYVLDVEGRTLASSNFDTPSSFVGQSYTYRPYFTEAITGKAGHFFAIGATTGRPGYFVSEPIHVGGLIRGVAVVKIEVESLQDDWEAAGEVVFASDGDGIIFLSSSRDFLFRALRPLSDSQRARIAAVRQYAGLPLAPLPFVVPRGAGEITHEGRSLLHVEEQLADFGWTLHVAVPLRGAAERALLAVVAVMAAGFLVVATVLVIGQRTVSRESALMRQANEALEREVGERRLTEAHLRAAQAELVQAEKLAALGKLSAAISHELNQPLAAMRTFLAATGLYQERGNAVKVRENLDTVRDLVDRMGSITGQLKSLARPGALRREEVNLGEALQTALRISEDKLKESGVEVSLAMPEDALLVMGDTVRIGQVLVNLIVNATEAMREADGVRRITLVLTREGTQALVQISDTGPGIDEAIANRLFDPFVTSKEESGGLGLGLSIAYGIVTDMGGTLRASTLPEGGARFELALPLANDKDDKR